MAMVRPSVKAIMLASSPSRQLSMTTWAPAGPNSLRTMMRSTASWASPSVSQTMAALPAARPSAFTTMGAPTISRYALARSAEVNVRKAAVGMLCRCMSCLAKTLLPSIRAACWLGPNTRSPELWNASTMPLTRGASGPTTVRSTPFCRAKRRSCRTSVCPMSTHSASSAMPALPGAQKTCSTSGESAIFQTRACSLPPPPTTSTFMPARPPCPYTWDSAAPVYRRPWGGSNAPPACGPATRCRAVRALSAGRRLSPPAPCGPHRGPPGLLRSGPPALRAALPAAPPAAGP